MWVQFIISEGCKGGIFGDLSLDFCFVQILEVRNDNGDGNGMTLGFIIE